MKVEYFKTYSSSLGKEMEFKVYGEGGKPFVIVPTQAGKFYEFEDRHMLDVYAPYIERREIQVFTLDSIDGETLEGFGYERERIERHEAWINYIIYEALPFFKEINRGYNEGYEFKFGVVGVSAGALHAADLFFRFPNYFDCLMGLSGLYSNEWYFGSYHDDLTYQNSPEQFLQQMPNDHPFINEYNEGKIILCVGSGDWEEVTKASTLHMKSIFEEKGISAWVDIWGNDVKHDWEWWYRQTAYFLPHLL